MTKRANVYKDSRGYVHFARMVDGVRFRASAKTEREARKRVDEKIAAYRSGEVVTKPSQTVAAFLTTWLRDVVQPTTEARTHQGYADIVRLHLAPELGALKLEKLAPAHIQKLYADRLKVLSPRTIQHIHACLHTALETARDWGLLRDNPADRVKAPKVPRRQGKSFDPEQARAFLAVLPGTPLEAYFVTALLTGLRTGELLALRWRDVDFKSSALHVQRAYTRVRGKGLVAKGTKTDTGRMVQLSVHALAALKRQQTRCKTLRIKAGPLWQDNDLVFPNRSGGPMHEGNIRRHHFLPLLEKAGLPVMRPYDLRHSFASLLLSSGAPPKDVQALLGHSQISLTMDTYGHVFKSGQRATVKILDDLLTGSE